MTLIILLYGPGPGRTSSASSSHREFDHSERPNPTLRHRTHINTSQHGHPSQKHIINAKPKAQAPQSSVPFLHRYLALCTLHPCVLFASQAQVTHRPCSSRCKYPAQTWLLLSSLWLHDARGAMGVLAVLASENICCVMRRRVVLCNGGVWGQWDKALERMLLAHHSQQTIFLSHLIEYWEG